MIRNHVHQGFQEPVQKLPWSKHAWCCFMLLPTFAWLILGQLFLMDRFLDGTFFTFGIEVISFAMRDEEDRVDPVIYIFPRMTKCTFHKFGSSGNIESHDALCILPINIVNEKIYVFLWFWFLLLGSLTFLVILYRLIIIFSPRMRAYLLFIRFRLIKKECINIIIKKTQMGDWFLLYMLGQNVDSMIYKELIHELARRLGYSSKDLIDFWISLIMYMYRVFHFEIISIMKYSVYVPMFRDRIWNKSGKISPRCIIFLHVFVPMEKIVRVIITKMYLSFMMYWKTK